MIPRREDHKKERSVGGGLKRNGVSKERVRVRRRVVGKVRGEARRRKEVSEGEERRGEERRAVGWA